MLQPIVINEYGETFELSGKPDEDNPLIDCLKIHGWCGGFVDLTQVSDRSAAFTCRKCSLRVVVPRILKKWEDLRTYMKGRGIG